MCILNASDFFVMPLQASHKIAAAISDNHKLLHDDLRIALQAHILVISFKDVIEQVETQMEQGFTTEELALLRRLLLRVATMLL